MIITPEINVITLVILEKSCNEENREYAYFYLRETIRSWKTLNFNCPETTTGSRYKKTEAINAVFQF